MAFNMTVSVTILCLINLLLGSYSFFINTAWADFQEQKVSILSSDDNKLKTGMLISNATSINLSPRGTVRFLSPSGEVYKIVGPYSGPISGAFRETHRALSLFKELVDLVYVQGKKQSHIGAYRGSNNDERIERPRFRQQHVPVPMGSRREVVCLTPKQEILLTRSGPITSSKHTQLDTQLKVWLNTEEVFALYWPITQNSLLIRRGKLKKQPKRVAFTLGEKGTVTAVKIWYHQQFDNPGKQLLWFDQYGCDRQLQAAMHYYRSF